MKRLWLGMTAVFAMVGCLSADPGPTSASNPGIVSGLSPSASAGQSASVSPSASTGLTAGVSPSAGVGQSTSVSPSASLVQSTSVSPSAGSVEPKALESMAVPGWGLRLDGGEAVYTAASSGWDAELALMYRLNRLFSVGFDVDYLTDFWNGALIQDDWEFYSDNGFESNAANGLWIGPELDYGFWPARRLNMHFDLALGVFSLTGTTNEFQGTPA